ncbi:MAG TPA: VOC family protein, partial [Gemmatimonadaceae bacterium]|nr:VOC family protein [Gemmatimonadaceae bacterium]
MQLHGIHHLTAVSSSIRENLRFYTNTMGMRLVKRSVNQDDVSAYHLFYADAVGSPGTDLTFFDWAMPPEKRGTNSIVRTMLRVAGGESLSWWKERFAELGVTHGEITERDGRATLDFEDGE